jgi:hypothetical protein
VLLKRKQIFCLAFGRIRTDSELALVSVAVGHWRWADGAQLTGHVGMGLGLLLCPSAQFGVTSAQVAVQLF